VIFKRKVGLQNKISKTGLFCLLFISSNLLLGMQSNTPSSNQGVTRVYAEYADSTVFEKDNNPDVHILMGNVVFRHDSTYMFCDSAYLYNENNSLEAFSNVRIEQGDTLFIYGDYLIYEGNLNLAKMRYDVRMENHNITLFTDSFNYDRNINVGYYFDGGLMVDSLNELSSIYGQYSPDTKIATFKDSVTLLNPQFTLKSDTLKYNTIDRIATILGPTVIESDSGTIHSTNGWYHTETGRSTLYDRSTVVTKDGTKRITADTLFYNRDIGFGEAFSNMVIDDTTRKVILMGHYGYYDELKDFAFATDSAQFIEYSQKDSLFLHADTLQMQTIGEEREIKAFHGVRIYRVDLQAVCDSLQFNTKDSTLYLYRNPILWNTGYQITGDTIQILFNDSTLERVNVLDRSFAMEKRDSTYFNQIKGKNLTAFFNEGELVQIEVEGNTESIYYPIEDKGTEFLGRNKTESTYMTIYVENRKLAKILLWPSPVAEMVPIPDLSPETKFLKEFVNYDYLRPKSKDDIFTKTVIKAEDVPAPRRQRLNR